MTPDIHSVQLIGHATKKYRVKFKRPPYRVFVDVGDGPGEAKNRDQARRIAVRKVKNKLKENNLL